MGDFDLSLLISVSSGLGQSEYINESKRVYHKSDDCLGEHLDTACSAHACSRAAHNSRRYTYIVMLHDMQSGTAGRSLLHALLSHGWCCC
jgi:hypothetical protein